LTEACAASVNPRINSSRSSRLLLAADALIILSACGAFDLTFQMLSLEKESRLFLFTLTTIYVAYRLAAEPGVRKSIKRQIGNDPLFWSLPIFTVTWAYLSSTWSASSLDTFLSSSAFAATLTTGIYLGYQYSIDALLRLVAFCLSLTLLISVVVCLLFPEFGVMQSPQFDALHEGRWRGIYKHKNWLGLFSGLSCVVTHQLCSYLKFCIREK